MEEPLSLVRMKFIVGFLSDSELLAEDTSTNLSIRKIMLEKLIELAKSDVSSVLFMFFFIIQMLFFYLKFF